MVKKEFTYKGKSEAQLSQLSIQQFAALIPSRIRRKIRRGFTPLEQTFLRKVEKNEKNLETHCRDMPILPVMFGKTIKVYTGKEFQILAVNAEMSGHVLGEFALTRKGVKHNAPGIGATKSSAAMSVK